MPQSLCLLEWFIACGPYVMLTTRRTSITLGAGWELPALLIFSCYSKAFPRANVGLQGVVVRYSQPKAGPILGPRHLPGSTRVLCKPSQKVIKVLRGQRKLDKGYRQTTPCAINSVTSSGRAHQLAFTPLPWYTQTH